MDRQVVQGLFVSGIEGPHAFIEELQHTDDLAVLIPNRLSKQFPRLVADIPVHGGIETRINGCILNSYRLAVSCNPSRNTPPHRQANLVLLQPETFQGPYFTTFAIHKKNGPTVSAAEMGTKLKDNVQ